MSKSFAIARNSAFSLVAWFIPIAVQLLSVPFIVKNLGTDQYGVWALVMAVMGYFAFLDMNIVKGGIRYLAEHDSVGDYDGANQVISLGILAYLIIGLIGMLSIAASVPLILMPMLKIPSELIGVGRTVLYLSSIGFLLLMLQTYLVSVPKALHRFDISSKLEMSFQICSTLTTVMLVYFGFGLLHVVVGRLLASFVWILLSLTSVKRVVSYFRPTLTFDSKIIKKLAAYSVVSFAGRLGMATTSHANTFVSGAILGMTAVTFYSLPFLLVGRIMGVTNSLAMVLFPIASELGARGKHQELLSIYKKLTKYLFAVNIYLAIVLGLFSSQILTIWVDAEFAQSAGTVMQLIAIGTLSSSTTALASLVNDGIGHPKVTSIFALAHGVVLVVFSVILGFSFGLHGIATSYAITGLVMSVAFNFYVHSRVIGVAWSHIVQVAYGRTLIFAVLASTIILWGQVSNVPGAFSYKAILLEITLLTASFCGFFYFFILEEIDKRKIMGHLTKRKTLT